MEHPQPTGGHGSRGFFKEIALLALACFAVSCAHTKTYVEPALPKGQAATLEAFAPVWLMSVDGAEVPGGGWGDDRRVTISPGPHTVEVYYAGYETVMNTWTGRPSIRKRPVRSMGTVKLPLIAQAGRTYVVNDGRAADKWRPTIGEFLPVK